MDRTALHLETRNALSIADELSRYEHAVGNDELTAHLAALRTSLDELERDLGRSHEAAEAGVPKPQTVASVARAAAHLRSRRDELPRLERPRLAALIASAERVVFGLIRPTAAVPSKPLLGVLPLARVVPQDLHTAFDYLCAGALATSAKLARTPGGRAVGLTLALGGAKLSMLTDHRLGVAKLVPIEVHAAADGLMGLSCIAAPFVLGYLRKDPIASAIQIATGAFMILTSLITDYRASRGVTIPMRSRGGPAAVRERGRRVPEVQRPLEGFSSAPTDWRPDG